LFDRNPVTALRRRFSTPASCAFTETRAKSSIVAPCVSMSRLAERANRKAWSCPGTLKFVLECRVAFSRAGSQPSNPHRAPSLRRRRQPQRRSTTAIRPKPRPRRRCQSSASRFRQCRCPGHSPGPPSCQSIADWRKPLQPKSLDSSVVQRRTSGLAAEIRNAPLRECSEGALADPST